MLERLNDFQPPVAAAGTPSVTSFADLPGSPSDGDLHYVDWTGIGYDKVLFEYDSTHSEWVALLNQDYVELPIWKGGGLNTDAFTLSTDAARPTLSESGGVITVTYDSSTTLVKDVLTSKFGIPNGAQLLMGVEPVGTPSPTTGLARVITQLGKAHEVSAIEGAVGRNTSPSWFWDDASFDSAGGFTNEDGTSSSLSAGTVYDSVIDFRQVSRGYDSSHIEMASYVEANGGSQLSADAEIVKSNAFSEPTKVILKLNDDTDVEVQMKLHYVKVRA